MPKLSPHRLGAALTASLFAALALAAPASSETKNLTAKLTGSEVIPAADPDGSGTATIKVDDDKRSVCFKLSLYGIDEPIAAHIHKAPKGKNGDPVLRLSTGVPLSQSGCVKKVSASLVKQISAKPAGFYVNLHTEEFPKGAIRGQLAGRSDEE